MAENAGETMQTGGSGSLPPGTAPGLPPAPPVTPGGPGPAPARRSDRYDRFTERAKKVLVLAQDEATHHFNHNYIGTEHLLLGLVRESEGVGAKVLGNLGIGLDRVRRSVEFIVGRGDRPVTGDVSLTPRAKKVVELAHDEARRLSHNHVGTEHLLLGMVREGEGIAAGILISMGVSLDQVRAQVIQTASTAEAVQSATTVPARDNVITCRINDQDLLAIDTLIEAGVRSTRSDAASWLIHAGVEANRSLIEQVKGTVAEIRRLRFQAQMLAQRAMSGEPGQPPAGAAPDRSPEAAGSDAPREPASPGDAEHPGTGDTPPAGGPGGTTGPAA